TRAKSITQLVSECAGQRRLVIHMSSIGRKALPEMKGTLDCTCPPSRRMSDNCLFERGVSPTLIVCYPRIQPKPHATSAVIFCWMHGQPRFTLARVTVTMMRLRRHELTSDGAVFAISAAIVVMFMG